MRLTGPTSVYLIENDRDARARVLSEAELASFPDVIVHIVACMPPAALPMLVCRVLARSDAWRQRADALAPFLAHLAAWERVAEADAPALIAEAQVSFAGLARLLALDLPDDADIVFLGSRMVVSDREAAHVIEARVIEARVIGARVIDMTGLLRGLDTATSGPAADGYLLTPAAARRLIEAVEADGLYGFVGGRLLQYATTDAALEPFAAASRAVAIARVHRHPRTPPAFGILRGYGVTPPPLLPRGSAAPVKRAPIADTIAR